MDPIYKFDIAWHRYHVHQTFSTLLLFLIIGIVIGCTDCERVCIVVVRLLLLLSQMSDIFAISNFAQFKGKKEEEEEKISYKNKRPFPIRPCHIIYIAHSR